MLRSNLFSVVFNADMDNGAGAEPVAGGEVANGAAGEGKTKRKPAKRKANVPPAQRYAGTANQKLFSWLAAQSKGAEGRACAAALGVAGIPNVLKHWVVAGYVSRTNARPTTYATTPKGRAAAKSNHGLLPAVPATNPSAHRDAKTGMGKGYTIGGTAYTVAYNGSGAKGRAAWGKPIKRKPKVRKPKAAQEATPAPAMPHSAAS